MKALQKITITVLVLCAVLYNVHAQPPKFSATVNSNTNNGGNYFCGAATGTVSVRNSADGSSPSDAIQWDEGTFVSTNPDGTENFTVSNSYYGQSSDFAFSLPSGTTKSYRAMVMVYGAATYSSSVTLYSAVPPVAGTLSATTTAFLNSGSGAITYTGGTGSIQWMTKAPTDQTWTNINNGNFNISQTMQYAIQAYNPATYFSNGYYYSVCPPMTSTPITIEVYKPGTINGPPQTVEGSRISMNVLAYYKNIIQWEYSTDGGTTWSIINFPYDALRYEIVANTTFRALVDLGPFGSGYTPNYSVTYSPYTQFDHPLVNGSNSVKEQAINVKNITDPSTVNSLSVYQKLEAITYLDGHGRAIQKNMRSASPLQKDIVSFTDYDRLGRQPVQYQPYVSATNDGLYKSDPVGDQLSFYTNPVDDKIANNTQPFAVSVYESSPIGRLMEQGSPGSQSQPGGGHTKLMLYANNAASDVLQFNSDGTSAGYYVANALSLTQGTDEDGKMKQVFTDTQGRTILSRTQLGETVNGTLIPWLETYYIYNDRNAIRYIVSPKGAAALKAGGQWADIYTQYVHEFVYDTRGRVVQKKVPGQDWMYYCYDRFDRLILAQDGKLRQQNNWLFFKYDKKGRVVRQGLYTDAVNTTLAAMQTNVVSPLYANATDVFFEDNSSTNYCFPNSSISDLATSQYDYSAQTYTAQGLPNEATPGSTTGLLTSSSKLILGTTTWITSYYFYDAEGRLIQELSNNHLSQTLNNLKTYVYDFTGKTMQVKTYHHTAATTLTINNKYFYDPAGRLKQVYQQNNTDTEVLAVDYRYNEVGQLVEKNLHCTTCTEPAAGSSITTLEATYTSGQFLQSVDMRYDVRGNLASINNAQLTADGTTNDDTNDYFGMEFLYQDGLTSPGNGLYNGNMSAVKWKNLGDGPSGVANQHSYQYTYDNANRLRSATSQMNDGTAWTKEAGALNESTTYDFNGNIQTLQRNGRNYSLGVNNGKLSGSYGQAAIDNLTYTYNPNLGDQLLKVTDATSLSSGFDNGASAANNDYTYDTNGNVLTDLNKGISGITYNYIGKPTQVNFTDGRQLNYVYDAAGNKLTMSAKAANNTVTTTDYVGSFVYTNTTLSFFSSPEGRVIKNSTGLEYQYAIADHQGNTRVVFTSAAPAAQSVTATFETAARPSEVGLFTNYPTAAGINPVSTNNKDTGGTDSQILSGVLHSQVGVSKSYQVYPGDKLQIGAWTRYDAPTNNPSNLVGFAAALLGAYGLTAPAQGEFGTPRAGLNTWGGIEVGGFGDGTNDNTDVKAFVNIILFDVNYNFLDVAFAQVNSSGALTYISASYTVKQAGYAFMYISNENAKQANAYFDDVTMTYTPTNIIQYNEYYPFGLQAATSWTRSGSSNNFLYNEGTELNTTSGWYETAFRGYDPALGRFAQIDPLATKNGSFSGYHYSFNNPVMFNDPTGADPNPGSMNNWGGYEPPQFTGDMSNEDWMAYTRPGGSPSYESDDNSGHYAVTTETTYYSSPRDATEIQVTKVSFYWVPDPPEAQGPLLTDSNNLTQSGNPLAEFANSFFGDKVNSIKTSLNFAIDDKGEYTNYDPTTKSGIAGRTVGNRQGITVYFDPDVVNDFDRLYVFMAHELEHSFNISNGNRSAWSATYGPLSSVLSEIYAYGVGAQAANGLGLQYDFGQQSQHDQLTIQFLEGLYNK